MTEFISNLFILHFLVTITSILGCLFLARLLYKERKYSYKLQNKLDAFYLSQICVESECDTEKLSPHKYCKNHVVIHTDRGDHDTYD